MPINAMEEKDFWKDYELIRAEISTATELFYTYIEVHNFASEDKLNYKKLNRHPAFWNITLYSLQTSFFIVLGRIFDDGSDAHSIHKVLASCIAHPEFFSKESLAARRTVNAKKPDYLDDLLSRAFQPSVQDFRDIKRSLSNYRKNFNEVYRNIRHLVFAHKVLKDQNDISALFGKTQIKETEDILYFLNDLIQVIWELYQNGREPKLGVMTYDYKDRIKKTTRSLLSTMN